MSAAFEEDESAVELLERRWFAVNLAAVKLRDECKVLAEAVEDAETAWSGARSRLKELEAVCDALGEELARRHALPSRPRMERAERGFAPVYQADCSGGGKSEKVSRMRRAASTYTQK